MKILDQIPFTLDEPALFGRQHMDPEDEYGAEMAGLARRVAAAARPRAVYSEAFIDERGADTVTLAGVTFTSRVLRSNLENVHRVFPYIATCGPEMDLVPVDAGDFLADFCRDVVKEMALRAATQHLTERLREVHGLGKLAAMHPGSGDVDVWPLQQQREMFSIFGDVEAHIGVRLSKTFLMHPNKSVSGVFYPTEVDFQTCQLCHRVDCPNRCAEFNEELWRSKMGD